MRDYILRADPLLLKEIEAIEGRIVDIGRNSEIVTRWGLSGHPLQVNIGSDDESFALLRSKNQRIPSIGIPVRNSLLALINQACGDHLCEKAEVDLGAIELNLKHGNSSQIFETFQQWQRQSQS